MTGEDSIRSGSPPGPRVPARCRCSGRQPPQPPPTPGDRSWTGTCRRERRSAGARRSGRAAARRPGSPARASGVVRVLHPQPQPQSLIRTGDPLGMKPDHPVQRAPLPEQPPGHPAPLVRDLLGRLARSDVELCVRSPRPAVPTPGRSAAALARLPRRSMCTRCRRRRACRRRAARRSPGRRPGRSAAAGAGTGPGPAPRRRPGIPAGTRSGWRWPHSGRWPRSRAASAPRTGTGPDSSASPGDRGTGGSPRTGSRPRPGGRDPGGRR